MGECYSFESYGKGVRRVDWIYLARNRDKQWALWTR